jgi:hypothetical protein
MPGERRTIVTEVEYADARGENPRVGAEGFNVGDVKAAQKLQRRAASGGAISFDGR